MIELYDTEAGEQIEVAIEAHEKALLSFIRMLKTERDTLYLMLKLLMADNGIYDFNFSLNRDIEEIRNYKLKIIIPDEDSDEYSISLIFPNQ